MNASFVASDFSGGEWSPDAQGRFHDPKYKTGLNVCLNGFATEEGAWTRRPGFRYVQHTKAGAQAILRGFDFSITQPYQMEFTAGFLRFYAGVALAQTTDTPYIARVGTDNPATVYLASAMPADWANGDTVLFTLNTDPCAGPLLCGRQFTIHNVSSSAGTFTLADPITAAGIDGSTIAYVIPDAGQDQVRKVTELATPYALADLAGLRTVQDQANILILHDGYEPRLITEGVSPAPFAIATQAFADGPYMDPPGTALVPNTTTLTASGTSGSVTVTASAITNINGGLGFKSTDVGRLIRFQSGPKAWAGGTPYAKGAIVLGSDDNIYSAILPSTGVDPITDQNVDWQITDQVVTWTWMLITAVGSTTSVTATIKGATIPTTAGSAIWQLGLYSDTTGWPTAGVYHEGRLWLASQAFPNRVDASVSNDYFNFSPSDTDGTVADNNGISAVFNANDADACRWLLSTEDGLMLGTQSSEWRVRASVLDDPLSPSNIQVRRVSKYGCADVEPAQPAGQTVFVQRQGRKLEGHYQSTAERYAADNITHLADHLTGAGIAEVRWQQEPSLNLWARLNDDSLVGCVYRRSGYEEHYLRGYEDFAGFHRLTLGSGRDVESISAGPSFDGLSDTLYAVTNKTKVSDPDHNVRWVECLMPVFDAGQADCDAFFVDGGAVACCAKIQQISNGDSFNGLRIYGVWHLNGLTVSVSIGGLDCGDIAVSGGIVDVAFTSTFTLAFVEALSACDLFGAEASFRANTTNTPPYAGSLMGLVGAATPVGYNAFGGAVFVDHANNKLYFRETGPGTGAAGFKKIDGAVPGDELLQATETTTFGAGPAHTLQNVSGCYHPMGKLFASVDSGNSSPIAKIDATTLVVDEVVGSSGSSLLQSTSVNGLLTRLVASFQMIPLQAGSVDYIVSRGIRSASLFNEVAVIDVTTTGLMTLLYATQIAEAEAAMCTGRTGPGYPTASFYVLGRLHSYGGGATTPAVLYAYQVTGATVGKRTVRASIAPTDIDATWTNFSAVSNPGYDKADGHVVAFFSTLDAVTQTDYLVKFDALTGTILWKTGVSNGVTTSVDLPQCDLRGTLEYYDYGALSGTHQVARVNLSTGAVSSTTVWNPGLVLDGAQVFEAVTGSITLCCAYADAGSPDPTYIGDYLPGHSNAIPSFRWGRIYSGAPYTTHTDTLYPIYGSIGFTYTSDGQLLEPDSGADAGAQNGPAFGKTRRLHRYAAKLARTQGISIGTDFSKLNVVPLQSDGGTVVSAPTLFSGTVTRTLTDDYTHSGRIAWRITRPYPATITALGGFIESSDR